MLRVKGVLMNEKRGLLDFKGLHIEDRLRKAFNIVIAVASIASIIGIICLLVVVSNLKSAMNNYALPQGDIALFMNEYAECRSNVRGIIGYEDTDMIDSLVAKHATRRANTKERYKELKANIVTKEGEAAYNKIGKALDDYFAKEDEIIKLGATTDQELCRQAQHIAINELAPLYETLDAATLELMNINIEKEEEQSLYCSVLQWCSIILMVILTLTAAISSKKIATTISRGIAKPLAQLEKRFDAFAKGDIMSDFPTSIANDEIGELMNSSHEMAEQLKLIIGDVDRMCAEMSARNFNVESACANAYVGDLAGLYQSIKTMNQNVSEALREVESVSNQVNDGATNLSEAASNLAEGATEQAASIEEMLATMNTVSEGLRFTSQSVNDSYTQLSNCAANAQASHAEMGNMVASMNRINETSKKIEYIIAEIESIASQTNLLSLNASIEAARAGDAGRGFAVVADEIRDLADQSAKSAIDTRELVNSTLREIEEGNRVANKTADVLYGVVDSIQKIALNSKTLSENTQIQAEAVEQADQGIARISEVVQSNSAAAEECYATSEELSAQAATMHDLVAQFQFKR